MGVIQKETPNLLEASGFDPVAQDVRLNRLLEAASLNPLEDRWSFAVRNPGDPDEMQIDLSIARESAKVGVLATTPGDTEPGFLVPTTSPHEDGREGDGDFFGGGMHLDEDPIQAILRELGSEAEGLEVDVESMIPVVTTDWKRKERLVPDLGKIVVKKRTHILFTVGRAPNGITFGTNEKGRVEHSALTIVKPELLRKVTWSDKYPESAESAVGLLAIELLRRKAVPIVIPEEQREHRW